MNTESAIAALVLAICQGPRYALASIRDWLCRKNAHNHTAGCSANILCMDRRRCTTAFEGLESEVIHRGICMGTKLLDIRSSLEKRISEFRGLETAEQNSLIQTAHENALHGPASLSIRKSHSGTEMFCVPLCQCLLTDLMSAMCFYCLLLLSLDTSLSRKYRL